MVAGDMFESLCKIEYDGLREREKMRNKVTTALYLLQSHYLKGERVKRT